MEYGEEASIGKIDTIIRRIAHIAYKIRTIPAKKRSEESECYFKKSICPSSSESPCWCVIGTVVLFLLLSSELPKKDCVSSYVDRIV